MTKKSDQQRQKIIAVSRELFTQKGYTETTTREINDRAGIAEGLLYYYFPKGKRQLLDTIVREGVDDRVRIAKNMTVGWTRETIEQDVVGLFEKMWQLLGDGIGYQEFIITIRNRAMLSDEQSAWLVQSFESVQQLVADSLFEITSAEITKERTHQLAMAIMATFQKVIFDELLIRNRQELPAGTHAFISGQVHLLMQLI
ncbi:TetR/AcrR family transcriptional regulator [Levilactobacillus brevis]|uniref:TetR/AcrR family transcriptional regulator n=1 Tax=Levilactobacillus hammesii TaxID=267633 RepID=A0A921EZP5_9LACO|nr:TetR/AcrR family transcriptional regulator [Levilactobacillus brevis]HJE86721.1 TetR/AcrR family transcriptional regulator [Levilactobacillus hammesii]